MGFEAAKINNEEVKTKRLVVKEKLELVHETITAAGVVSVSTPVSYIVTGAGAMALTLANGYQGQRKLIIMQTDGGGTATLTPANFANGTTIVFDDAYDNWEGIFHSGNWYNIGTPTAT